MPEQTTPVTGVEQAAPSVEERMAAFLSREEQQEPQEEPRATEQAEQPEQPEGQAPQTDEVTVDDLPDESVQAQPAVDAFEIVHNGQQHKLSREDVIRYAQQGFDYTQKTQAVAAQARQIEVALQRAAELEQLTPLVAQDLATVKAFEAQLAQYQNVNWVQLATSDPLEYPKHRAQYDTLVSAYQAAVHQFQQKGQALNQRRQELTAQQLQQESARLKELIPTWNQANAAEMRQWLLSQGADQGRVDSVNSALEVSIAWKAMQYDKLQRAKAEKVKQLRTAPPVTKPNAPVARNAALADRERDMMGRLKKTGDLRDAAAVLLNRMK
jgi:hypothetical protein